MSEELVFYLNDTHDRNVVNWLADFTQQARWPWWPTSDVLVPVPMRWNTEPKGDNPITTESMYGVVPHVFREENESISEPGPQESPRSAVVIQFKFLPIREKQLRMTVTLVHPAAREYLDDVVGHMAQDYPEMQPSDSETVSEVERIHFVLNATFDLFRGWLLGHTENVSERHFPISERESLYLHPPRVWTLGCENGAHVLALTVGHLRTLPDGKREARAADRHRPYLDKDRNETGVSQCLGAVWGIWFKVLPLAAERVEVTAEGVEPEVLGYFRELLQAIGETYPEARKAIDSYLFPEKESGGGDDKPRVPERGQDLRRWKRTWRVLKGKEEYLHSYQEISKWLKKMHPNLAYSADIVADIIRAGDAGLLDS